MGDNEGGMGPTVDTAVGEIVTIMLSGSDLHGMRLQADKDGCGAVIASFERLPNGKFGIIQRHGGVHVKDCLLTINDTLVENMVHREVIQMLENKNVLKKQLKFINNADYYAKKKKMLATTGVKVESNRQQFLSIVKRARISTRAGSKVAEYEIACQWRVAANRIEKDRVVQWSVWKRYSEFETLHGMLKKSLGWQMDGVEFPPSYSLTINKLSGEFIERRKEELNTYWQNVIAINKVTEFDKHHCSQELKQFLDFDSASQQPVVSAADMSAMQSAAEGEGAEATAGGPRPAANRRLSLKPGSSRRLSAKQSSVVAFDEGSGPAPITSPPSAKAAASSSGAPSPPPATATPSSPPPPPAAAPAPAANMSAVMRENLAKYTKMKTMLPEGAVRQRMGADGCSESEIDAFFGETGTPAPPPPPSLKATPPPTAPAAAPKPTAAPAPAAAPASLPPKTQARANLLSSINALRKE